MPICKIIIKNEIDCIITGLSPDHRNILFHKFRFQKEGCRFTPQFKLGRWDGYINYFQEHGATYVKLLDEIIPEIVNFGCYTIQVEDNRKAIPEIVGKATPDMFSDIIGYKGKPLEVRDYQVDSINTLIENNGGLIIAATGAGKSIICAGLSKIYGDNGYKTITIVPSADLVNQTYETYKMVKLNVSQYSEIKKDINREYDHLVSTWQALQNLPSLMKEFDMVIVDECHGAKASVIKSLLTEYGQNIIFRFGVTGTLPKPKTDQYDIKLSLGVPVKYITARWLIDNGYLADIKIEILKTYETEALPDYQAEKSYLSKKEDRLELLSDLIQEYKEMYGNTLVLVNSVKMGRQLGKIIPDSTFLSGETKNETRKENYDEFENSNDIVKIATYGIASTGISIDRLFVIFMIDVGKSFIKTIQTIGRGTRLAHDKDKVIIVDCTSNLKYSKKHLNNRRKYYKEVEYEIIKTKTIKY